jgi:hypothetical protein
MRRSALHTAGRPGRRRVTFSSVLLACGALLASLLLAEIAARVVVPQRKWLQDYEGQAAATVGMLRPDLRLGHLPVAGGSTYDEHGLLRGHGLRGGPDREPGVQRVLFLGDSVTARGRIVDPLCRLWDRGPAEFLNAGIEGANPVQSVEVYMRHQRQLSPDQVVLTMHNNDFTSTRMCLLDDDGAYVLCVQGTNLRFDGGLYDACTLYRLLVGARCRNLNTGDGYLHQAPAVATSLRTLRDETAARGAKLTVLLLPIFDAFGNWRPHQIASRELALRMLADLGIPVIDLLPATRELLVAGVDLLQIPGDTWHPGTECGEHLAAAAVQAGLFAEPDGDAEVPGRRPGAPLRILSKR